jgi:uncharacterized protein
MRQQLMRIGLCFILFFSYSVRADIAVPALTQRVTDMTGTLTQPQSNALEQKIITFEQQQTAGAQIALLIVPTLDGETIEQFATRVFDKWKLGRQSQDNGVLLLVAKEDHLVRIEVGYGFEGGLTDIQSSRIIQRDLVPAFRQNDYYGGLSHALDSIIRALNHELSTSDQQQSVSNPTGEDLLQSPLMPLSFITLFLYSTVMRYIPWSWPRKSTGRRNVVAGGLNGITAGAVNFFITLSANSSIRMAFIVFVISTIICGYFSNIGRRGGGGGNFPRGGFGGGSGNYGGGGGFSGGGGRSGGGGASGRW